MRHKHDMFTHLESPLLADSDCPDVKLKPPCLPPMMRKYYQVLLTAFAIVSACLFLFYKHEYDRLRHVMEVMETFGVHEELDENKGGQRFMKEVDGLRPANYHFEPTPAWTNIHKNSYVFSAFWDTTISVDGREIGKILAVAVDELSAPQELSCSIWVEGSSKKQEGSFASQMITDKTSPFLTRLDVADTFSVNNMAVYIYTCRVQAQESSPYAVSFYPKEKSYSNPVTIPVYSYRPANQHPDDIINVCLRSDSNPFNNVEQFLEFMVYYKAVQVDKFWVYSNGVSPKIDYLANIARASEVNVSLINVQYQPMLGALNKVVYFLDCIIRTRDTASFTLFTDLHNFVVPKFHNQLPRLFKDLMETAKSPPAFLVLKQLMFCKEFPDAKKIVLLPFKFLKKASYSSRQSVGEVVVVRPRMVWEGATVELVVADNAAAAHRYVPCGNPGEPTYEPAMFKFDKAVSSSLFLRRWKFLMWDRS